MKQVANNIVFDLSHQKLEAFSYVQGCTIGLYQMNVLTKVVTSCSQSHLADIVKSKQLLDLKGCLQTQFIASETSGAILRPKLYSSNYHSLEHALSAEYFNRGRNFVFDNELYNLSKKMASDINAPLKDVIETSQIKRFLQTMFLRDKTNIYIKDVEKEVRIGFYKRIFKGNSSKPRHVTPIYIKGMTTPIDYYIT